MSKTQSDGGCISGNQKTQTPLLKRRGQLSHGEAFSIQKTVFLTVIDRGKVCRQTVKNEKRRKSLFSERLPPCVLFPVLEDFIKGFIHRSFQALLHNLENFCLYGRLLLFLLFPALLCCHFFTLTSLLILISERASSSSIWRIRSLSNS